MQLIPLHQLIEMAEMRRRDFLEDAAKSRLGRRLRGEPRQRYEPRHARAKQAQRRRIWLPWGRPDLT